MTERPSSQGRLACLAKAFMGRVGGAGLLAIALLGIQPRPVEAVIDAEGAFLPSDLELKLCPNTGGGAAIGWSGEGSLLVNASSVLCVPGGLNIGGSLPFPPSSFPGAVGQGTVSIDGEGSLIDASSCFANVGRWGGGSSGYLSITNGGKLVAQRFGVGLGDAGAAPDGVNGSTGTVLVDGQGSSISLVAVPSACGGGIGAGSTIGHDGGTGSVSLTNGASLSVSVPQGGAGLALGDGGIGTLALENGATATIDGTWATLASGITVGFASGGTGDLALRTGAALTVLTPSGGGIGLGRQAGTAGTLGVEGGASLTITVKGGPGGMTIAGSGTGAVTVAGPGTAVLLDSLDAAGSPGILLGGESGASGVLDLSEGSTLTINTGATGGCCITVGQRGHGTLNITGGSQLLINDTGGIGPFRIAMGGNFVSEPSGGTFDVLVSGPGSALKISGTDAAIAIGRNTGSSGTMTVEDGATLEMDAFSVARNTGSTATLNVSGQNTRVKLTGDAEGSIGVGFAVGAGGAGTMNVTGGAVVTIDASATSAGLSGIRVGGSRVFGAGGTGALTVCDSGSRIDVIGSNGNVSMEVGFDLTGGGTPTAGTLTICAGGQIALGSSDLASVGATSGSQGTVTIDGAGSLLDAGAFLGIARDIADEPAGTGTLTVSNGGTAQATGIHCGAGGTINGDGGTLIGNVVIDAGCDFSPGFSPGTVSVIGSFASRGATLVLEVDASGNHDVLGILGTATFDPSTRIEIRVDPYYRPPGGARLELVRVRQAPADPPQALLSVVVPPDGGSALADPEGEFRTFGGAIVVTVGGVVADALRVDIDVKPGSFPNSIDLGSVGAIPVAILSTPAFDALQIDPASITLSGASVKLTGKGDRQLCSAEDVNGDGLVDLVCHVLTNQLQLQLGDAVAVLEAQAAGGITVMGWDLIRIVQE